MQNKLGLRVLTQHEATIADLVHPGKHVAFCPVDRIYEVGPLPHGLSHAQVADLLQAWTWTAKPLKPSRSTEGGQYWDVGTGTDPPAAILHTAQSSVTVTCKHEKGRSQPHRPAIQASARTKKHMRTQIPVAVKYSDADPWIAHDPWKQWSPTQHPEGDTSGQEIVFTDSRSSSSQGPKQRIDALEQRLMQQVDQKLAALPPPGLSDMDTDDSASRDVDITELKAQALKFESWFNDVGARFSKMDSQLQAQHAQMAQMQSALDAQQATTSSLQHALEGLNKSFRAELQVTMEAQTSRLEALLEKRARSS